MEVDELHNRIFEYMNDHYPFFVHHFLRLGRPVDTRLTPYALVAWYPETDEVVLNLNTENLQGLPDEQLVFFCMHEAMHVLLQHHQQDFPNHDKANIAQDIVINDYLVDRGIEKVEGLYYGEPTIGQDSVGMSAAEVYALLPDMPQMPSPCVGDGEGGSGQSGDQQGDGTCGAEERNLPPGWVDWFKSSSDSFNDFVDAQKTSLDDGKPGGTGVGSETGSMQEWIKSKGVTLKWAELLKRIHPDLFKGEAENTLRTHTFNRLHRKIAWAAPRVVLPVYRETDLEGNDQGDKPLVVIAVDTSGSIADSTKKKFMQLVDSIPQEEIDMRACTFTTNYMVFNPEKPRFRSGGTNFSAIEEFIRDKVEPELGKYPDAVVVLTDGHAYWGSAKPTKEQEKSWSWLLTQGGRLRVSGNFNMRAKLSDYTK